MVLDMLHCFAADFFVDIAVLIDTGTFKCHFIKFEVSLK